MRRRLGRRRSRGRARSRPARANEALQGGVSCAEQIDAQPFEPFPDHLWGQVPAGVDTGKQPRAGSHPTGGSEVGSAAGVVDEHVCERLRYGDRLFAQPDVHVIVGDCDRRRRQSRDPGQGLSEQQQEGSSNAISQCFGISGKQFSKPCQTLLLGERAAGRSLLMSDVH